MKGWCEALQLSVCLASETLGSQPHMATTTEIKNIEVGVRVKQVGGLSFQR